MRAACAAIMLSLMSAVMIGGAQAQVIIPPSTAPMVPPLPPIPPPRIEVPAVPKMNSPPPFELQNTTPGRVQADTPPAGRRTKRTQPSYGDRVSRCLEEGAALGLGPNERSEYSRACANR
jgi:hypothetical protein